MQSLQTFTKIHVNVDRVAKDNLARYGKEYYVNTTGIPLSEAEIEREWEANFQKYGLSKKEIEETRVPYYRRSEDPEHLRLKKSEQIQDLEEDEELALKYFEKEVAREKRSEQYYRKHFLPHVLSLFQENPEWGYQHFGFPSQKLVSFGLRKLNGINTQAVVDTTGTWNPYELNLNEKFTPASKLRDSRPDCLSTFFPHERLLIVMRPSREAKQFSPGEVVLCERLNSNLWVMTSNMHGRSPWSFSTIPDKANPIQLEITKESLETFAQVQPLFDVIVADPPWNVASSNPTRGVALPYPTMSVKKILSLPYEKLQREGYTLMWVVTKSYTEVVRHMNKDITYEKTGHLSVIKYRTEKHSLHNL